MCARRRCGPSLRKRSPRSPRSSARARRKGSSNCDESVGVPDEGRRIYRFDDFTLDVGEHRLQRGDQDLYLPPKTFGVLLYLVERHGHLVKKNELLDGVWADAIVTENALTWSINQVRDAIQDDAQHPRYIQTIPRVGYKFIAEVEELTATEAQEEDEEEEYTALSVRVTEEKPETENGRMGEWETERKEEYTPSPTRPFAHSFFLVAPQPNNSDGWCIADGVGCA